MIRTHYRLAALLLAAVLFAVNFREITVQAQGQAGGGSLSGTRWAARR